MSVLGKQISSRAVAALALIMVAVGGLLPVLSKAPVREIDLVAREMSFYLDGNTASSNPVIEVAAGETVRLVLRNDDKGFVHDLAVPRLELATKSLRWKEEASVTFSAPTTPGTYEYICQPHATMMRGTLRVK